MFKYLKKLKGLQKIQLTVVCLRLRYKRLYHDLLARGVIKMKCIYCDSQTKVTNKRDAGSGTRRRRECLKCKKRFTTFEQPELKDIMVIKKDGSREVFDSQKIIRGMIRACERRPVNTDKIGTIVKEIESKIRETNKTEIKTKKIGEMVMAALKKLDKVAYIRFASVYKDFQDVGEFKKEIKELK